MLKQYALLTKCETELKKTKMPPILRLKIDMQIMQAKCTLLDSDVKAKIQGNASSEKSFADLYDQVARSRAAQGETGWDEILVNLHSINQGLEMSLLGVPP